MRITTKNTSGSVSTTYSGTLEQNKTEVLNIVKTLFEEELAVRTFESSLGFPVQNRRFGTKNDLQNIDSLIFTQVSFFRDANNIQQAVTLENLITIKNEMISDGLSLYQAKFQKEALIESATTKPQVWQVID